MPDLVNNPPHYKSGGIECIDVLEALNLPFHLANVIKYLWRHRSKGHPLEDLRKARWYLDRYITIQEMQAGSAVCSAVSFENGGVRISSQSSGGADAVR